MRRNILEWIVLVAGLLAVFGLVGMLALQAVGYADRPPDIAVEAQPDEAHATELGWQLPVEVRNEGDQTAAAITIEGVATVAGQEEIATIDVDLLAGGGSIVRVVAFSGAPEGDVRFRLVGYSVP